MTDTQLNSQQSIFLLRIEAINLGNFILDTNDLSTIRGAGMLLLGTHQFLTQTDTDWESGSGPLFTAAAGTWQCRLKTPDCTLSLELLSLGASIVIYQFTASEDQAAALQKEVSRWLRTHKYLRHATFAVAVVPWKKDFQNTSEHAVVAVRRHQLRYTSVSPGRIQQDGIQGAGFCDLDGKRAATVDLSKQSPRDQRSAYAKAAAKNFASEATRTRRSFGRDRKVRIYHMLQQELQQQQSVELTEAQNSMFTPAWEFSEIVDRSNDARQQNDPAIDKDSQEDQWSNLNGKMAVIYIDGNKFSKQIRAVATKAEAQLQVDQRIREMRANLMKSLTERMTEPEREYWKVNVTPPGSSSPTPVFRIETLLWGGDELIWVVPAWCALEAVQFFFEQTSNWTLADDNPPQNIPRLTHAVGLVFCSHKAPIRNVVALARHLADNSKDLLARKFRPKDANQNNPASQQPTGSEPAYYNRPLSNVLSCQVLESFDHLGSDVNKARERHRFPQMTARQMTLSARQLDALIATLNTMRNEVQLHHRRLHQIGQFLQRSPLPEPSDSGNPAPSEIPLWPAYEKLMRRIAETAESGGQMKAEDIFKQLMQPCNQPAEEDWSDQAPAGGKVAAKLSDTEQARNAVAWWYHIIELWDYLGSCNTRIVPHKGAGVNTKGGGP